MSVHPPTGSYTDLVVVFAVSAMVKAKLGSSIFKQTLVGLQRSLVCWMVCCALKSFMLFWIEICDTFADVLRVKKVSMPSGASNSCMISSHCQTTTCGGTAIQILDKGLRTSTLGKMGSGPSLCGQLGI